MDDDFFSKLDTKLQQRKTKEAEANSVAEANAKFVASIIPRLVSIAESYADKCKERGIPVGVSSYPQGLEFNLKYKNGSRRTLSGSSAYDQQNRFAFEDHYPDTDGKRYKSLPTSWYDESNWSDDIFEAKLKKTIEDFVFYADRFQGF